MGVGDSSDWLNQPNSDNFGTNSENPATFEQSLNKLEQAYDSAGDEMNETQNVTLEDLIAVTYQEEPSMSLTQHLRNLLDEDSNHAGGQLDSQNIISAERSIKSYKIHQKEHQNDNGVNLKYMQKIPQKQDSQSNNGLKQTKDGEKHERKRN